MKHTDPMDTTVPTSPLRWGLVGYGAGGRIFHRPLLTSAHELALTAVVTASPERVAQVRADLPDTQVVSRLSDLADLGVVGVTITTPTATHTDVAHEALALGLHVVVDKPFALSAAAAAEVLSHAVEVNRLAVPYQNRRFDSDFRTLRALVARGDLGAVHGFGSRIERSRPVKSSWHSADASHGGGVLFDLGPHLLDQALVLWGPVRAVFADFQQVRPGVAAEDVVTIHLEHTNGVRSDIVASLASAAAGPRFLVNGSRAGFVSYGFDGQEAQLKAGLSPADLGAGWGVEPESAWGHLFLGDDEVAVPSLPGAWDRFYPRVARAILGGGPPPVTGREALVLATVLDACRESATQGQVVELTPGVHL